MPHTTPTPDLLERLGTNLSTGLSPKEAARRQASRTDAPLFRSLPRRYADCVKKTAREPALWLMAAVAFISLFFGRVAMGLFCLLLTLGNTALCAYFLYQADRTEAAMLAYDAPLCRVLRGGRLLRMGAEGLVVGDVILLRRGDIVPADCRLLRADGLTVMERELDAASPLRPPERLEKNADVTVTPPIDPRHSPVNMVYAGSLVDGGNGLAVVTAVGSETHLGGLIGHIPSAHQGKGIGYFKKVAGGLSVYNLCILCMVVPLTALGIFTVGDTYEFLDIFLSLTALASLTLTEHLLAKGIHLASAARRGAAVDRDSENSAEIKSSATLESLTAMTDLLLVGSAALHDGCPHPETLRVGRRLYLCDRPDADEEVRAVAEYLYLYRSGAAALPSTGGEGEDVMPLLTAVCEWAEVDTEALQVKLRDIRPEGRGVGGTIPSPHGDRRVVVRLTPYFDEAEGCSHIHNGSSAVPMSREEQNNLYRYYREAARQGSTPLFLLVETPDTEGGAATATVRAMLTYAPVTCRKTAGCIRNLERAGVRVTALLRDLSDGNTRALAACGLTDSIPADRPAPDGTPRPAAALRMAEGCRAFEGCTEDFISACMADLKAEGRTVGLLSVDEEDVALLAEADIAFTCAPSLYASAEGGLPTLGETTDGEVADGHPQAAVANDCSRRAAHVVVRRSSATGGGVLGRRQLPVLAGSGAAVRASVPDHPCRYDGSAAGLGAGHIRRACPLGVGTLRGSPCDDRSAGDPRALHAAGQTEGGRAHCPSSPRLYSRRDRRPCGGCPALGCRGDRRSLRRRIRGRPALFRSALHLGSADGGVPHLPSASPQFHRVLLYLRSGAGLRGGLGRGAGGGAGAPVGSLPAFDGACGLSADGGDCRGGGEEGWMIVIRTKGISHEVAF